jgi:hypothetical protein
MSKTTIILITIAVASLIIFGLMQRSSSSSLVFAKDSFINEIKVFKGMIASISQRHLKEGTYLKIVVSDQCHQSRSFLLKPSTAIFSPEWLVASLGDIKEKDSVRIKYIVRKYGLNETISVNILKAS